MYKCRNFKLYELIDRELFRASGEAAWLRFDDRALITLDTLRDHLGPLTVNDWYWHGRFNWRGLRHPGYSEYSPTSQHASGRAFDCVSRLHTAEEMRQFIYSNPDLFPHIRGIEVGVNWLHFDVGNRDTRGGQWQKFGSGK